MRISNSRINHRPFLTHFAAAFAAFNTTLAGLIHDETAAEGSNAGHEAAVVVALLFLRWWL